MSEEMQAQQNITSATNEPIERVTPNVVEGDKSSHLLPIILSSLITVLVLVGGYFLFLNNNPKNITTNPSPTPISSINPSASVDPISTWKTYTNNTHKITFKYPQTWILDDSTANEPLNARIQLTKDQAFISMQLKLDGIGGSGRNYQGVPYEFAGLKLYKYHVDNTYNNTQGWGITDSLNQSLGFFVYSGKPYSITLTYPNALLNTPEEKSLLAEFDQILATFKYSQLTSDDNILQIIPYLTNPMLWTFEKEGTLADAAGKEIQGTLITSMVASKEQNKLARFLVTDSPLVTKYGWKEDPSGMGDGVGESLSTYLKGSQKLIIRYANSQYKVLLSK